MNDQIIQSIDVFINKILIYIKDKDIKIPWFRGEPKSKTPLLPRIYRDHYSPEYENRLLQTFRLKGRSIQNAPDRNRYDEWLFIAQHYKLPTRLLDWTEGALIALFFALSCKEENPVVWVLDPLKLNLLSYPDTCDNHFEFPLTWVESNNNIGNINFKGAWGHNRIGTNIPVAIYPPSIDQRIFSQKSCFTIQGIDSRNLVEITQEKEIVNYFEICNNSRNTMLQDLRKLGITYSTLFPDLEGLSKDITQESLSIKE